MAKLLSDEFIEGISEAIKQTISDAFNSRLTTLVIHDGVHWWFLFQSLGTQLRINLDTGKEENHHMFLAVKTEEPVKKRIDSPAEVSLIVLPQSEIDKRKILYRRFEL